MLRAAVRYYDHFVRETSDDPEMTAERGRAYMRYARIISKIASMPQALELAQQGRTIFTRLVQEHPHNSVYQYLLSRAQSDLGDLFTDTFQAARAQEAYQKAITLQEQLVGKHPGQRKYQSHLASTYHNLGLLYLSTNQTKLALKTYRRALDIKSRLVKDNFLLLERHHELALTLTELACLYHCTGRYDEAEKPCRRALAIYLFLAAVDPANTIYQKDLGRGHVVMGLVHFTRNHGPQAIAELTRARAVFVKLVQAHPSVIEYHKGLAVTQNNLGEAYSLSGRLKDAETAFRAGLVVFDRLAKEHPTVLEYAVNRGAGNSGLAGVFQQQGKYPEALQGFEQAVGILEPLLPSAEAGRLLWGAYAGHAEVLSKLGRHKQALTDLEKALKVCPRHTHNKIRVQRAVTLAYLGNHQRAAEEANDLANRRNVTPDMLYDLACVYAVSMKAVLDDGPKTEEYAGLALQLLNRARAAGFFRKPAVVDQLKTDPDLKPLQPRDDFKQFCAGVEKQFGK
jgi:tetratricopeptide (TPR) repeat protein